MAHFLSNTCILYAHSQVISIMLPRELNIYQFCNVIQYKNWTQQYHHWAKYQCVGCIFFANLVRSCGDILLLQLKVILCQRLVCGKFFHCIRAMFTSHANCIIDRSHCWNSGLLPSTPLGKSVGAMRIYKLLWSFKLKSIRIGFACNNLLPALDQGFAVDSIKIREKKSSKQQKSEYELKVLKTFAYTDCRC